jgi:hypothetical protein
MTLVFLNGSLRTEGVHFDIKGVDYLFRGELNVGDRLTVLELGTVLCRTEYRARFDETKWLKDHSTAEDPSPDILPGYYAKWVLEAED